ncbi:unnamed protein product [Phytomonas sp. Hart1]|nr:unnamed protein product [Phytomonas sp. Hart1]|eukprot:CCW66729.1 unnamed protein product [Phytomonas sp. isolate Hart1]
MLSRRAAALISGGLLPVISFRASTTKVKTSQSSNSVTRSKTWGWGSNELNKLSFLDMAETYSKKRDELYIREYGHGTPVWSVDDVQKVQINHRKPKGLSDHIAYCAVRIMRWSFDTFSMYRIGRVTERKVVNRCLFLETVAGVPGMVGGMLRHLKSLRRMERDQGWIQTLLDEAENERMHLMTFIEMRQPGLFFRMCVLAAQGIMFNLLLVLYMLCPRFVHRFVGYLEEEAVITYTSILEHLDKGELGGISSHVPQIAKEYWSLPNDASFRDLIAVIRADEAEHRIVNHTFADMHLHRLENSANPFNILKETGGEKSQ